jgi:hypothetical protein
MPRLFLSTTGTNVVISELGITITHPTTDFEIDAQFTAEEIKLAPTLTSAINAGTLVWKKTAGGAAQTAANYDSDYLEATELNEGPSSDSRVVLQSGSTVLSLDASSQATANSTKVLTKESNTQQVFTGTVAGQILRLPVATTLRVGHIFEVWNFSSATINIVDDGLVSQTVLKANSRTTAILRDNTTANGVWGLTYTLDNGNVFGTQIYYQEAIAETSTTSTTTFLNKVSLTTPSLPLGDYLVQFQFIWRALNANRTLDVRVQRAAANIAAWTPFTGNVADRQLLSGFIRLTTISGVQTFTLDFKVSGTATTVYMSQAKLFVWRVG